MVLLDPEGAHAAKERPHGIAGGQSSAKSGIGTTFEQADPAGLDGRAKLPARGPHLPPPPRLPQRDPHVPKRAPEEHPQSAAPEDSRLEAVWRSIVSQPVDRLHLSRPEAATVCRVVPRTRGVTGSSRSGR